MRFSGNSACFFCTNRCSTRLLKREDAICADHQFVMLLHTNGHSFLRQHCNQKKAAVQYSVLFRMQEAECVYTQLVARQRQPNREIWLLLATRPNASPL